MKSFSISSLLTKEQLETIQEKAQAGNQIKCFFASCFDFIAPSRSLPFLEQGALLANISTGFSLSCPTFKVVAPFSGYYNYFEILKVEHATGYNPYGNEKTKKVLEADIICYETDEEVYEKCYNFTCHITADSFTKKPMILWERINEDGLHYMRTSMGICLGRRGPIINLIIKDEQPNLQIEFCYALRIKPKSIKRIKFLFNDCKILSFIVDIKKTVNKGQSSNIWYLGLSYEDIEIFKNNQVQAIRLESDTDVEDINHIYKSEAILLTHHFKTFCDALKECNIELVSMSAVEDGSEGKPSISEKCYVYLMHDEANGFYKIGISNHPEYREHTLQSEKPTITLLKAKEYPTRAIAEAFEAALHKTYESKRLRGEWFKLEATDVDVLIKTLS